MGTSCLTEDITWDDKQVDWNDFTFAEFSVNKPQEALYLQLLRHLSGVSQSYALNIGPHNP